VEAGAAPQAETTSSSITEGAGDQTQAPSTQENVNYESGSPYSGYGYDGSHSGQPDDSASTPESTPYQSGSGDPPSEGTTETSGGGDDDDGGGPVKSFLEHLEDLRWVIVKCATALFVGMLICLIGTNHLVSILKWPLSQAGKVHTSFISADPTHKVGLAVGTNLLFKFKTEATNIAGVSFTNPVVVLEFVPVQVGTQSFLTLQLTSNAVVAAQLDKGPGLVYIDPATPFMSSLHIAFYGGIVLVAPFLFFFLGQYIVPALRWKEKKYFLRAFGIGLGLFLLGVCFCYFWMAPVALRAAEQYSLWMGIDVPEWRAETYFSFLCKFMLGMGLGFEMPVVLLALVKIGILDYQKLAGFRRYMIVINLILGAVLTTPEVVTQLLMFVPLQLLYEVSIWIAWYWERREKKRAAAEAKAGGGEVE
jgi:sec-independent protein translocase protein TatC